MMKEIKLAISLKKDLRINYVAICNRLTTAQISYYNIIGFRDKPVYNRNLGLWSNADYTLDWESIGAIYSSRDSKIQYSLRPKGGTSLQRISEKHILYIVIGVDIDKFKYVAMDKDGGITLYENRPFLDMEMNIWNNISQTVYATVAKINADYLPVNWNCKKTLRRISDYIR